MVPKPFSGRFLFLCTQGIFLETQTMIHSLQMISTGGLPGFPEETKKMEAKQESKSNLRTPQTQNTMGNWRTRDSPSSTSQQKTSHLQPHLVSVYLVATETKLHLRHQGKIKAIYTNHIVGQKEQHFPSLALRSQRATLVLTEEASGAAHVVFFEKSQCTHISYITHTGPKCARGGDWGGVQGVQAVTCLCNSKSSKIHIPNVKFCQVARYCFTVILDLLPSRVSLVDFLHRQ